MHSTNSAIAAAGVRKRYKGAKGALALDGFDLEVPSGTVYGLLGPNGAGKTTAIKILATLLQPDAGQAFVAGFNVRTHPAEVRARIGLVGQYAAVDEILTGHQNLVLFGRLYHLARRAAERRAAELLAQFGLAEAAHRPVGQYSGGMRRRLDLAAGLIVAPPVLFVDEPTTGLDPAGRREVWQALRALVATGTTLLLTTQYLEEADQLAGRIAMLKAGRVIAEGTPAELKAALGGDWIDLALSPADEAARVADLLAPLAAGAVRVEAEANRLSVPVADRTRALIAAATMLAEAGIEPADLTLRRPTLDEVFLHLTGADQPQEAPV